MGFEEIKLGKDAKKYTPEDEERLDQLRESIYKSGGKIISRIYEEILERQMAEN